MKIGIASPISLRLLADCVDHGSDLPCGYSFPFLALLVREYLRGGHRVEVFALDPTITRAQTFTGPALTIHIGRYRPRPRDRGLDFFAAERADLLSAMRRSDCGILHAHWTYEFALAGLDSGLPCLITAHDAPWSVLRYGPNGYRMIRLMMAMKVGRRAQTMTAVSPYVAEHWRKYLLHHEPMEVIPNGLPDSNFAPAAKTGQDGPVRFAAVLTGWGKRKNGSTLLEAFSRVRRELPDAQLTLLGDGYGVGEEGHIWAMRRELTGGVHFAGAQPYDRLLARLGEQTDILVHPALEECHPLSVVEAMALGLPVIGGRHSGGVPWTLDNGHAGLLTDVAHAPALAEAMVRLGRDLALRNALAHAGWLRAGQEFRISTTANRYLAAYERILASSGRPAPVSA